MTKSSAYDYDYLIVGAGMFGSTIARLLVDSGYKVKVIDRRCHIAGNCYTEEKDGIHIHRFGPHIFHTSNKIVWDFIRKFSNFNSFVNTPLAISKAKLYSLPFNMHTFQQLWGVKTPLEAQQIIKNQTINLEGPPKNLEEQALALVGEDIYHTLIRDYTFKQWQKDPKLLPPEIIKRIPLRYTYNCNYFNDLYQGIPIGGYTQLFMNMLSGIEVGLGIDFLDDRSFWEERAKTIIYTGKIDEFFDYSLGELEYRTLVFIDEWHNNDNVQGNAVINYCDANIPWTRIIEHRHFDPPAQNQCSSILTKELPDSWNRAKVPYYPIGTSENINLYAKYKSMAGSAEKYVFGGRLAEYKYYDMHAACASAFLKYKEIVSSNKNSAE